eukprot:5380583-Pyramimonas_sp.AAC.1
MDRTTIGGCGRKFKLAAGEKSPPGPKGVHFRSLLAACSSGRLSSAASPPPCSCCPVAGALKTPAAAAAAPPMSRARSAKLPRRATSAAPPVHCQGTPALIQGTPSNPLARLVPAAQAGHDGAADASAT